MSGATITHAGGTIAPHALDGYSSKRRAGNVVHPILGTADVDVTFRPASRRTGRLVLAFTDETAAAACEAAHATGETFTLTVPARPTYDMTYVVDADGDLSLEQDRSGVPLWRVAIDFREVSA